MFRTEKPTLTHSAFPVTGQPIRVVMIDGEPWFATTDVCRILGRTNPSEAAKMLKGHQTQTLDMRTVGLATSEPYEEPAGRNAYGRGNPTLNLVSESGLYTLVMRSRKPSAEPFQQWVTAELLPSLRRGDINIEAERLRMADVLTGAVEHRPVDLLSQVDGIQEGDFRVLADGAVHCLHGRTDVFVPKREENSGPYFRCPELRRVGIRGSKGIRPCGSIRFVDVVRRLAAPREPETPAAAATPPTGPGLMSLNIGKARVHGTAQEIAGLLRELGIAVA
ncbi:Bro-N domain-containing protein [Streptacidiphilus sp. N1-3]|uniref:Bro-N domain-containing protein n=1 Tax=Streptacidiphilus alkalitolerans TaxID=3342712 RepID=A0ABV6X027_9ACTN